MHIHTAQTDGALIGDATPDGWNCDQNMTWNPTTRVFTATINLVAGDIKFRANDDWAVNLGGDSYCTYTWWR